MGGRPGVRAERGVVRLAGQKAIEHVLDVHPDIQVVAHRTADQRQEVGRAIPGLDTADEQPVFPFMLSFA